MSAQPEMPQKSQPDLDPVIDSREYPPVPTVDYVEGDMPIEKFVPVGPCCRIAHYELHVRTVDRVFVDTVEWTPGCPECGRLHDGQCAHTPTTWGWRKN
jgi:hypothetical protein